VKILVSGRGGCGKSTISAMLGLPKVKTLAEHLGGKKEGEGTHGR